MTEYQKIAIGLLGTVRTLQFTLAALASGSRVLGLADNREVVQGLAERAKALYGPE